MTSTDRDAVAPRRWHVVVVPEDDTNAILVDSVHRLGMHIEKRDGEWLLWAPQFESLTSSGDVHNLLKEIVKAIDLAMRLQHLPGLSIGTKVFEMMPDGVTRCDHFVELQGAVVTIAGGTLTASISGGTQEQQEQRLRAECARQHEARVARAAATAATAMRGATAMRILELRNRELTTQTMNAIGELIHHDLGGRLEQLGLKAEWIRFRASINHPAIFGDKARHAVRKEAPHPHPMNETEAQVFVVRLVQTWIEFRSNAAG